MDFHIADVKKHFFPQLVNRNPSFLLDVLQLLPVLLPSIFEFGLQLLFVLDLLRLVLLPILDVMELLLLDRNFLQLEIVLHHKLSI